MNVHDYTKSDFLKMENFLPKKPFNEVVIVPTRKMHESGYESMKFILASGSEIVGVVSGWSDVMHLNGIGGYGRDITTALKTRKVDLVGWRIDCLHKSHCVRLFTDKQLELDEGFIGSDFIFYVK